MARRRWRKLLIILLLLLVGVPALYLIAALGLALIPVNRDFAQLPEGQGVEIQLVSNGVHVDFVLPVSTRVMDWESRFPRASFPAVGSGPQHILVGWGNREFYLETPTWADLKVSTALRAVFWPSPTVVHVQYVRGPFEEDATCRSVRISEAAYGELCAFVEEAFRRDRAGGFQLIPGRGYGPTDNFYEGTGSYHAFNTCNSWTMRGLKRTGVRTALWSPFAFGVLRHLP